MSALTATSGQQNNRNRALWTKVLALWTKVLALWTKVPVALGGVQDEAMIPYKGRTVLKQYMQKKPIKWGFKLFNFCAIYKGIFTLSKSTGAETPFNSIKDSHMTQFKAPHIWQLHCYKVRHFVTK